MSLLNDIQNINEANDFDCQRSNFESWALGDIIVKSSLKITEIYHLKKISFNFNGQIQYLS